VRHPLIDHELVEHVGLVVDVEAAVRRIGDWRYKMPQTWVLPAEVTYYRPRGGTRAMHALAWCRLLTAQGQSSCGTVASCCHRAQGSR
jgi:hypothetical protein